MSKVEPKFPKSALTILRYFLRNPDAADTYEGIARWRLLEETIHHTTEQTVQAVDWLESQGYLRRVPGAGSAPLFVLDQARSAEVASLLSRGKTNFERKAQSRGEES